MKINKDLVEAVMMLAIITLVLVWTTDFSDQAIKTAIMITLSVVAGIMVVFRVLAGKQP